MSRPTPPQTHPSEGLIASLTQSVQAMHAELQAVRQAQQAAADALASLIKTEAPRLTTAQVCARIGCTTNTIANRVKAGTFPRPVSRGRWTVESVMQWEQAQATQAQRGVARAVDF